MTLTQSTNNEPACPLDELHSNVVRDIQRSLNTDEVADGIVGINSEKPPTGVRHPYSTLLVSNGESVKVIQELMRHASSRSTLEICWQARSVGKRAAQQRVVMILPVDLNRKESTIEHQPVRADSAFEWIN